MLSRPSVFFHPSGLSFRRCCYVFDVPVPPFFPTDYFAHCVCVNLFFVVDRSFSITVFFTRFSQKRTDSTLNVYFAPSSSWPSDFAFPFSPSFVLPYQSPCHSYGSLTSPTPPYYGLPPCYTQPTLRISMLSPLPPLLRAILQALVYLRGLDVEDYKDTKSGYSITFVLRPPPSCASHFSPTLPPTPALLRTTRAGVGVLEYLRGLDVEDYKDIKLGYSITFTFAENPYFSNKELTKSYKYTEEGTANVEGTKIEWKEGMDLTAQKPKQDKAGKKRQLEEQESFFKWFEVDEATQGTSPPDDVSQSGGRGGIMSVRAVGGGGSCQSERWEGGDHVSQSGGRGGIMSVRAVGGGII
ncbi:unnamed protein product [Closterium sp. NIES-65]|nr:unnamed protein product [Closterium sp. NIES-65]